VTAAHDSPFGLASADENSPGGSFSRPVRLMVSDGDRLIHTDFDSLPTHLRAGDLLIANASATIPAALPARREDGTAVDLHLSTPHQEGHVVEVRHDGRRFKARAETLTLPRAAAPRCSRPTSALTGCGSRTWSSPNRCSRTCTATERPSGTARPNAR